MTRLFLLLCLFACSFTMYGQKSITGKVIDKKTGTPLSGVSIRLKGSSKGTSTNNQGIFIIDAPANGILEVSSIGYTNQLVTLTDGSTVTVALDQGSAELEQVVFVGSRGAARTKTESPVPVDVINVNSVGET